MGVATWEVTPRGTRRPVSSRSGGGGGSGVSNRTRELCRGTVFFPDDGVEVGAKGERTSKVETVEDGSAAIVLATGRRRKSKDICGRVFVFLFVRSVGLMRQFFPEANLFRSKNVQTRLQSGFAFDVH